MRRGKIPHVKAAKPKRPKQEAAPKVPPGYRVPVDTGDYARAWTTVRDDSGGMIYSTASPPVKAGVIEVGRRPAPIPVRPLAEWVRRKLGVQDPAEALGIAIAISKKAAKQKREGLGVLKRAHPKIVEAAQKNIYRELRSTKPGT